MSGSLAEVLSPAVWPGLTLVTARVAGLFLIAPLWSLPGIPATVRAAAAVVCAVILTPSIPVQLPTAVVALPLALAGELVVGLGLGLAAGLFLHATAIAGDVVALQMGLTVGSAFDPSTQASSPELGRVLNLFALSLYVGFDGPPHLLQGLADSFQLLPPGAAPSFGPAGRMLLEAIGGIFASAIVLAAPVAVALLVANVLLAVLTRAVPQLNIFAVAFPVTISIGLVALLSSLAFRTEVEARWISHMPQMLRDFAVALTLRGR
jgi:flagellar biosynthetic protein FliR